MKVFTTQVDGHTVLNYNYWPSTDCQCHFTLLSEVGEPWQKQAKALQHTLLTSNNARVVQVELDRAPWYVDAMISNKETTK